MLFLKAFGSGEGGVKMIRNYTGKDGFTLLELLVVVLIIGVLAAVALPQYEVAVAKSKYTQLMTLAKSYMQAEERYRLANGDYTHDFLELDVDIPNGWTLENEGKAIFSPDRKIRCTLQDGSSGGRSLTMYCKSRGMMYHAVHNYCGAETEIAKKVCKSLGGVYKMTISSGLEYYALPG